MFLTESSHQPRFSVFNIEPLSTEQDKYIQFYDFNVQLREVTVGSLDFSMRILRKINPSVTKIMCVCLTKAPWSKQVKHAQRGTSQALSGMLIGSCFNFPLI